jgi:hypothetical protein
MLALRDIAARLEVINAKLDELLRRRASNEPDFRPSAYAGSLSNRPLRTPPPQRVDPNLGTLA